MLNLKKLLTKLCARTNFRIVQEVTEQFTVSGGGTKWQSLPMPTSGRPIAIVGYQFAGTGNSSLVIYNWPPPIASNSFAIRNMGTVDAVVTLTVRYLVVD